jgi:hypothetical protein
MASDEKTIAVLSIEKLNSHSFKSQAQNQWHCE